jgi:mono/diheme cytochrome c family protein
MADAKRNTWMGRVRVGGLALCLLLPLACQQQMGEQPYYRPLEPSTFFPDSRSARPLPPGTVAQGQLRYDQPLYTGNDGTRRGAVLAVSLLGFGADGPLAVATVVLPLFENMAVADYATTFPFPVTTEVLERGQQRFSIFCAVCHDSTGNGNGKIVQRGYTRPPSYITDYSRGFERRGIKVLLRDVPVGYFFEVVSKGYGAMPDYASQVPPRDRWAIIAYVRALQLSQYARLEELPEGERQAVRKALEGKP